MAQMFSATDDTDFTDMNFKKKEVVFWVLSVQSVTSVAQIHL